MLYVFNIKKLRFPLIAALLFCILTAIIACRSKALIASEETIAAPVSGGYTLVIDPGHGGADGGASSANGLVESSVNLAVSLKLEAISQLFAICPVMTRTDEELNYPETAKTISQKKVWDQKSRVEQINSTDNAILISIHQNTYPDSRPNGAQVFYGQQSNSAEFGELTQTNLVNALCPKSRRVAAPISDTIYLMRHVNCPAILVECGFLSNSEEAVLLASSEYQTKLAGILFASYMQYISTINEPVPTHQIV